MVSGQMQALVWLKILFFEEMEWQT